MDNMMAYAGFVQFVFASWCAGMGAVVFGMLFPSSR